MVKAAMGELMDFRFVRWYIGVWYGMDDAIVVYRIERIR